MRLFLVLLFLVVPSSLFATLKVGSLHPLMTDLVRQVGGENVTLVEIGRPGVDLHTFAPRQKDLRALSSCHLVVASGKGIEPYLGDLRDSLGAIPVVEVGRSLPSRKLSAADSLYVCCPNHSHGAIDPHWWHDVKNMERAAKVVARALAEADPANAAVYKARGKEAQSRYAALNRWVKACLLYTSPSPRDS